MSAAEIPGGRWLRLGVLLGLASFSPVSADVGEPAPLRFVGEIREAADVSAVAALGDWLILGSDEGSRVQVLERAAAPGEYRVRGEIALLAGDVEIDIEAIATRGDVVYVAGSHSLKRKKLEPGRSYQNNRARLRKVVDEPERAWIFRFSLDPASATLASPIEKISLRQVIERDEILARFARIPGKENGIDIEGLAVDGKTLYVGFRSPVLRHGLVPILVTSFEDPSRYSLRFVDLGGRGVRDMAKVDGGFLILAGPAGELEAPYELYLWNGADGVPGRDRPPEPPEPLGRLPLPAGGTAEGLAVIGSQGGCWSVLVVYDGAPRGSPAVLRVCRSSASPPPRGAGVAPGADRSRARHAGAPGL